VLLLGVPKPGLRFKAPAFYRAVADQYDLPYDDDTMPRILSTPALKSDYAHPNGEGYREMAEAVAALIRKSQAS
jgi:lysophospholipase L1-like esterase